MPKNTGKRAPKKQPRRSANGTDPKLPFVGCNSSWNVSDAGGQDIFDFGRGQEIGEIGAMLFIKSLCRNATESRMSLRDVVLNMLGTNFGSFSMQRKGEIAGFFAVVDKLLAEGARNQSERYERLADEALVERFDALCKATCAEYRLGMEFAAMGGDDAMAAEIMVDIVQSPPRQRETLIKVAKRIAAESGRDHKPFTDAVRNFPAGLAVGEDKCAALERLLAEIPSGEA